MRVPKEELPNQEQIAALARQNLPPHYRLISVHCGYGSVALGIAPNDFQVVIEYANDLDEIESGTSESLDAHHQWAEPLIEAIRADWSPETIRIMFRERSPE